METILSPATLRSATIRVAPEAAAPVQFAAQELQRYLLRMGAKEISIIVDAALHPSRQLVLSTAGAAPGAVRPPDPAPLNSYAILPDAGQVILSAGSARALLSATYALLEQLGCRWSLHGAVEEVVPTLPEAGIEPLPLEHQARFERFGYCSDIMTWHYTQPEHFQDRLDDDRCFIDWMGKTGGNTYFYIRHPFDTQLTIAELAPDLQRRGIGVEYGGHVIPLLLPRELCAIHPEYFPQSARGERTELGNLCTSNEAALAVVAANAVQYARSYPEMQALHIWGADLWEGGWCRCSACAPLGPQDQSLRVCNAVARGLADAGLSNRVCYLAYHDTLSADVSLRPEAAVVCEFAPRERCYGHALDDPECATNQPYARALERYVDHFEGRVRLFEYYGDAILFFGCAVPLTRVIAADLDYYERLGIQEILMLEFGVYSTWAYPMNFAAFVDAGTRSRMAAPGAGPGDAKIAEVAVFRDLENIMADVVTYGDIRRPPREREERERLLARLESAVRRLGEVGERLQDPDDETTRAYGNLVRYTQAVLEGVVEELRTDAVADAFYAGALRLIEAVDRRYKGLWGTVDLPIIHSFYALAARRD